MKKNIAIVITDLKGSGAQKSVLNRAKILEKNGHNIYMFLIEDSKSYDVSEFNFPIISLTKYRNTFKVFGKIGDYIYMKILEREMKKTKVSFDIVFSHLPRADRVVKLLKHNNKYFTIHMSLKAELERFSKKRATKKLKLYRFLYKNEKLITVSEAMIEDFKDLKIDYKEVKTIYNPFDFEEIRNKGKEDIELNYKYIISPAAFKKQKRHDVLLDAFNLIKHDIKLLLLVKSEPKIIKMIKERGLEDKVIILGFKQNPYKYIKNAELLVLSSDREGLPRVVVESLVLDTPVVSTDCPTGPSEVLVEDLEKWLVPMENPEEMAKKIDLALESNIIIKEEYINKFKKETVYKELEKLVNEI